MLASKLADTASCWRTVVSVILKKGTNLTNRRIKFLLHFTKRHNLLYFSRRDQSSVYWYVLLYFNFVITVFIRLSTNHINSCFAGRNISSWRRSAWAEHTKELINNKKQHKKQIKNLSVHLINNKLKSMIFCRPNHSLLYCSGLGWPKCWSESEWNASIFS